MVHRKILEVCSYCHVSNIKIVKGTSWNHSAPANNTWSRLPSASFQYHRIGHPLLISENIETTLEYVDRIGHVTMQSNYLNWSSLYRYIGLEELKYIQHEKDLFILVIFYKISKIGNENPIFNKWTENQKSTFRDPEVYPEQI